MSPDATNFYDPIFDIPESMVFVDWASLYFPHPEWEVEFAGS